MICPDCGKELEDHAFLGKHNCYRCQYEIKIKVFRVSKKCKVCYKVLDRGHWSYCSEVCAKLGKDRKNKNYWTNLIH